MENNGNIIYNVVLSNDQDRKRDFECYNRYNGRSNGKIICIAVAQIPSNSQMVLKNIDPCGQNRVDNQSPP